MVNPLNSPKNGTLVVCITRTWKKRDKNASFLKKFTGKFTGTAVYCELTGEVQVPRENDEKKKLPGAR